MRRCTISFALTVMMLLTAGCDREERAKVRAWVFDDCGRAEALFDAALAIRSLDQAGRAFRDFDIKQSGTPASVFEAQITLLSQSIDCGCTIETHADLVAGHWLLGAGKPAEAEPYLRHAVKTWPSEDAIEELAKALEAQGRHTEAEEVRKRDYGW